MLVLIVLDEGGVGLRCGLMVMVHVACADMLFVLGMTLALQ